jgi:hypothetical protein
MFLSLVRPDRISSPMIMTAAVTRCWLVIDVFLPYMWRLPD